MKYAAHILLVDDDASLLKLLGMRLESRGYKVTTAESGRQALERLEQLRPDLVLSDLRMDEMDGLALFHQLQKRAPGLPVIILTAHGSIPDAVSATRQGVFSFLTKPVDRDELFSAIDDALSQTQGGTTTDGDDSWRSAIITRSPQMERVLEQARMVAGSDVSVLVTGPSGSGKELMANAIHQASSRADKPFVAINCGALPEQLLESELFGHAKGAFTGAISQHEGLFQAADGGTLFLDEIGDMPLPLQVKLLRTLQDRQIRPLGSTVSMGIDVRIISATHRDLDRAMSEGDFREDLYYRLKVVELPVPALRERPEDIAPLARHFLRRYAERFGVHNLREPDDLLARLRALPWPGNIRQLENALESLVALSAEGELDLALLSDAGGLGEVPEHDHYGLRLSLKQKLEAYEKGLLVSALEHADGNRSEAARALGIGRATLHDKLKKYALEGA